MSPTFHTLPFGHVSESGVPTAMPAHFLAYQNGSLLSLEVMALETDHLSQAALLSGSWFCSSCNHMSNSACDSLGTSSITSLRAVASF